MKKFFTGLAVLALAGCAAYKPIPDNYAGPIATVVDSGQTESLDKARIFSMTQIDGHDLTDSFETSHRASYGQGTVLHMTLTDHVVPAHPMKVKLRGAHATGAPIHEMASRIAGTFFEVEGVVDFNPEPDKTYTVVGALAKGDSSVWIEDAKTHQPVTEKLIGK
jgi:hypothetical protein